MNQKIPVYEIALPEYSIDSKPDYAVLGPPLDRFVEDHFPSRRMALRSIWLGDHPDLSRAELVDKIQELGTDYYDANRKMIHCEYYKKLGVVNALERSIENPSKQPRG